MSALVVASVNVEETSSASGGYAVAVRDAEGSRRVVFGGDQETCNVMRDKLVGVMDELSEFFGLAVQYETPAIR